METADYGLILYAILLANFIALIAGLVFYAAVLWRQGHDMGAIVEKSGLMIAAASMRTINIYIGFYLLYMLIYFGFSLLFGDVLGIFDVYKTR